MWLSPKFVWFPVLSRAHFVFRFHLRRKLLEHKIDAFNFHASCSLIWKLLPFRVLSHFSHGDVKRAKSICATPLILRSTFQQSGTTDHGSLSKQWKDMTCKCTTTYTTSLRREHERARLKYTVNRQEDYLGLRRHRRPTSRCIKICVRLTEMNRGVQ